MKIRSITLILFINLFISCNDSYKIEKDKVFYVVQTTFAAEHGGQGYKTLVKNADADSFEELEVGYGKDKNNVFLDGYLIKNADPKTFEIIDFKNENSYGEKNYSKDKKFVFFNGNQIEGANAKSFQILKEIPYSRDDKDYYFWDKPMKVSGMSHFKLKILENQQYKTYYAKDNKYFYTDTLKFLMADYKTYEYLGLGYAKDKINAYYFGEIIKDADSKTFNWDQYEDVYPRDKNFKYKGLKRYELTDTLH